MSITAEIEADVLRIYRQNPRRFSPFKAAKQSGCTLEEVFAIIEKNKEGLERVGERHGGLGRPDIAEFSVARRKAIGDQWDNSSPALAAARKAYEDGTHIMVTGRDGLWLILYSIPRKLGKKPKPGYFKMEVQS